MDAWDVALDRSGLPLMRVGRGSCSDRVRGAIAGRDGRRAGARRDPADRALRGLAGARGTGRRPCRTAGVSRALDDVWLGAPSLSGMVAAADYRSSWRRRGGRFSGRVGRRRWSNRSGATGNRPSAAARDSARHRSRPGCGPHAGAGPPARACEGRRRGGVRPSTVATRLCTSPMRVRRSSSGPARGLHPSLGSGRPEEVVAALGEQLGIPLVAEVDRSRARLSREPSEAS